MDWSRVVCDVTTAALVMWVLVGLDRRLTALDDRAATIELAVKALRERLEERGESSNEDPKPSELAWRALTLLQREIELEGGRPTR